MSTRKTTPLRIDKELENVIRKISRANNFSLTIASRPQFIYKELDKIYGNKKIGGARIDFSF